MTITPSQMRADFAEFANATNFPDAMLQFWLNLAYLRLNAYRWSTLLDTGAELYAGHNAILEFQNRRSASRGGAPGLQKGAVSGESVGPASQSYDTSSSSQEGWGNYNMTNLGTRFAELANMVGAGPLQL
jgi:Protein of unknown function (DUF4054)